MSKSLRAFRRTAAESATVDDLLAGVCPGRVQSVGRMQVLPLLAGDAPTADLGDPAGLGISTDNYGTLHFRNETAGPVLVPSHLAVIVSQAAQDHAMPRAALVTAGGARSYAAAMCVQQTQGGLIRHGRHRLAVLPPSLREAASDLPAEPGYNRLWPAVSRFKDSAQVPGAADLVQFLKRFATELDQFVAEFECVDDQIGAVVLMDNRVVGVERAPSHTYWRALWEPLIRFCYGAEAVRREAAGIPADPGARVPLTPPRGGDGTDTLALLAAAVRDANAREQATAERTAAATAAAPVVVGVDEEAAGIAVGTVVGDALIGAYALAGETPVYASLTARGLL
ncbi:hypothetical protein LO772_15365 [Yinghuangia sp. ASG 101]|uniref:ARPP-1 family domain-containing protein n=1 Tax=Yinghuangia sp. ASG 101 TaxID=2896848 RepID=UPI001E5146D4|nr:DUF6569 family protein [Yinghuangia sp. ASG 101]UGQ14824.1 hypothetical protein LO772_15365 [Yinghuangia sp. ASG 101]